MKLDGRSVVEGSLRRYGITQCWGFWFSWEVKNKIFKRFQICCINQELSTSNHDFRTHQLHRILNSAPYRGNRPETSRYCRSGRSFPLSLTSTFPTSHSDENRSFPPNFPRKRRENGGVERAISSISSSSNLRPLSIKQTDFSPRGHNYGGKLFPSFPINLLCGDTIWRNLNAIL